MKRIPAKSSGQPDTRGATVLWAGVALALCVILLLAQPQLDVFSRARTGSQPEPVEATVVVTAEGGETELLVITATPDPNYYYAEETPTPDYAATISGAQSATPVAPPAGAAATPAATERLIIREGSITIQVEDPPVSRETIEGIVAALASQGAFVVSSAEQGGSDTELPTITMVVRVPPTEFDGIMDRLAGMAVKVLARSETAQDVTEEYVDLQGRIEAMEAGHRRLFAIMEAITTTTELLEVEDQLTRRESEMEALQGRLSYLSQSAQLSRIDITLRPYVPAAAPQKPITRWELNKVYPSWQPSTTVQRAVDDLLLRVRRVVDVAIYFSIATLPWLLVVGAVGYGGWRWLRWWWRRRRPSEEESVKQ